MRGKHADGKADHYSLWVGWGVGGKHADGKADHYSLWEGWGVGGQTC